MRILFAQQQDMLASVRVLIDADVVAARRTARALSESLAMNDSQRTQWSAGVGFVAEFALHRAGGADVRFEDTEQEGVRGIQVTLTARDPQPSEARVGLHHDPLFVEVQRAVDAVSIDKDEEGRTRIRLIKWEDLAQRRLRERARDLV